MRTFEGILGAGLIDTGDPNGRLALNFDLSRTQAQGNAGDRFIRITPVPDSGVTPAPVFEITHERSLHGSTYNHVVKIGFNHKTNDPAYGRLWMSQESNYETGDPAHPFATEFHLSMARKGGPERRAFSAVCDRDVDYVQSGFVADKQTWETTGGVSYLSLGATGMDLGTGFGLRKGTNNQTFLSQLNAAGSAYKEIARVSSLDQVQIAPGQGAVLIDGALNRGEVSLAFATALVVNTAAADIFRVAQMTDNMTIDLQGLPLGGTKGRIYLRQAAVGGKKITAITCTDTGRDVRMDLTVNPTTINTAAFLVAGALAVLTYEVTNAGGVPYVKVALEATGTPGYA